MGYMDFIVLSMQLFVKNVPKKRTVEELKGMFAQFGEVMGLVPVPSRKNVVYMVRVLKTTFYGYDQCFPQYMDPEGARAAIDQLYGIAVAKHSKPLIVEVSQVSECKNIIDPPYRPTKGHVSPMQLRVQVHLVTVQFVSSQSLVWVYLTELKGSAFFWVVEEPKWCFILVSAAYAMDALSRSKSL
jgi:hypothetical protein